MSLKTMRFFPLLFLAFGCLPAQDVPPLSIKVEVNLVNIAFVARDSSGALVRILTKEDIDVFEDGVKQEVKFFNRSDDLPLVLALVVDGSESQGKFVKQHRADVEAFVAASIRPTDRALLVCFGDHIRVVSDLTSSAAAMMSAFDQFEKGSGREFPELDPDKTRSDGTALFDAIYATASEKLKADAGERKALILFSDGEDNSSSHDLMDAIEAAQSADSPIYTIRYTTPRHGRLTARNRYGIREMDRLAAETGAESFDASKGDVAATLQRVAADLRAMYKVGYVSTNPARDGLFHTVVIRAKRDGFTLRAKPGYYAR